MQTCENAIIEAHILHHSAVTRIYSVLICSKIQVYDVMAEYNN